MLIGYIGYYLCRKNLSAALPFLEKTFGYTNEQLGLIGLYSGIAYAVGKLINGPLGDKIGGRRIFLIGMAGAIFFNILFAQFSTLTMFIIIWCIVRYFLSMGWGGIVKTIGAWYEPERNGTIMGLISLNYQFGGVIATLFAGLLVILGFTWDKLFIFPAVVLGIIWILSSIFSKDSPRTVIPGTRFGQSESGKKPVADFESMGNKKISVFHILKTLFKIPIFLHILLFSFLTTALRSVFFFWTPKFLSDIGMNHSNAILKSAIFPFLGVLGTVLLGWYTDKYAPNGNRARMMWIMLIGLVLTLIAISFIVPYRLEYQDLIVALLGLSGFFLLGPYSMSAGCLTLDIAGSKGASSTSGMIDGVGYIGEAIAVWGVGTLSIASGAWTVDNISITSGGWSNVFMILSGLALLSVFSAVLMSGYFKRQAKRNL